MKATQALGSDLMALPSDGAVYDRLAERRCEFILLLGFPLQIVLAFASLSPEHFSFPRPAT
jgi:hypothetical protein